MNILLINPPRFHGLPVIREERCEITDRDAVIPPYSLLQVAAQLKAAGHEVQLIDANLLNLSWSQLTTKLSSLSFDFLVFRFTPTTFEWDMKTAKISKKLLPRAVTIGICWTLRTLPLKVLESAPDMDIYILHESEVVVPLVISAFFKGESLSTVPGIAYRENDAAKITELAVPELNWDFLPLPAYDLLPNLEGYFVNIPQGGAFTILYSSKGCPYSCIYCTERRTTLKKRSAESILKELRYLKSVHNVKVVSFFDETFTIDRERAILISKSIKTENLGIVWYCNTRVNLVDPELLRILYDGGCRGISFGIESGSQLILNNAQKGVTVRQAEHAIKWAKEAGIKVLCSFMFGLPGENWATVKETIGFIKRTLPTGAQINVAVPYPGTELYKIAIENNWVKEGIGWNMFQHESIMRTAELDYNDLNKARRLAYRSLYFNPKWWLQNVWYIARNPSDFSLAKQYVLKILRNYLVYGMVHAH